MATLSNPASPHRIDPYLRLLHRFYEPLILLKQLAPYHRDYILVHPRDGTPKAIRRNFIKSLAYICDSQKGGKTTTAIGLEQEMDSLCFWIAQNANVSQQTRSFLGETLEILKETTPLHANSSLCAAEGRLLNHCLDFAKQRIKKERELLLKALRSCAERNIGDQGITLLLQELEDCTEPVPVCQIAYWARHMNLRHITVTALQLLNGAQLMDGNTYHISNIKHRIDRLAHHVRVVKQLIEDSPYLIPLLDKFHVACVPHIPCVGAPPEDSHTTIDGVLKRMLRKDDPKFMQYQELMLSLNRKFNVFDQFLKSYRNKNWKPIVHCEVQVLEHFFREKLKYFENDKNIDAAGCLAFAADCTFATTQLVVSSQNPIRRSILIGALRCLIGLQIVKDLSINELSLMK